MREAGEAVAEVVTGEAVVLEVPCARFPSRLLALAIDMAIQVILLIVLFLIVGLGGCDRADRAGHRDRGLPSALGDADSGRFARQVRAGIARGQRRRGSRAV